MAVIIVSLTLFLWIFWPAFLGAPYIPSTLSCVKIVLNLIDLQPNQTMDIGGWTRLKFTKSSLLTPFPLPTDSDQDAIRKRLAWF